jgi:hypothetical protein
VLKSLADWITQPAVHEVGREAFWGLGFGIKLYLNNNQRKRRCGKVIAEPRTHVCFGFKGGDRLKFSNVILAVATLAVIDVLVYFVLGIALIPSVGSYWGLNSAAILSLLVAGLVVGCVFAGKIQEESRIRAVGKIAVLFGAVTSSAVMLSVSANGYYSAWVKETLQSMYSTGAWTTTDWYVYEQLALVEQVALNVLLALVLGFIGLYAGSMLRKPKKS